MSDGSWKIPAFIGKQRSHWEYTFFACWIPIFNNKIYRIWFFVVGSFGCFSWLLFSHPQSVNSRLGILNTFLDICVLGTIAIWYYLEVQRSKVKNEKKIRTTTYIWLIYVSKNPIQSYSMCPLSLPASSLSFLHMLDHIISNQE